MQVNPVAVIYKAELLESDNRLGRCQAEGNTITPTPALYQRTGIDTQIESGILHTTILVLKPKDLP